MERTGKKLFILEVAQVIVIPKFKLTVEDHCPPLHQKLDSSQTKGHRDSTKTQASAHGACEKREHAAALPSLSLGRGTRAGT